MLIERLNADMKEAMKAREALRVSVLRMTLSEVKNARIEKGKDAELSDDEVIQVLRRALKKREEAVEQYQAAQRLDLADKEASEGEILRAYLPQMLEGAALEAAVDAAIHEANAQSAKDLGKVMKLIMAAHGGRVDGKAAQNLAKTRLEGQG
jgi:hypothetical protein